MKKFIVHSTRYIKSSSNRRAGYFRDYAEFVETDNIEQYINNNFTFVFGGASNKKTFCRAVEVEDLTHSASYKYIEKAGGVRIYHRDNDGFIHFDIDSSKILTKYDFNLKDWM